jgi:hypothetical protein
MRIVCAEQHSAEWMQARTYVVTASRMADAMAKLSRKSKNGDAGDYAAAHWKYVSELAWEGITGVCAEHYVSKPMEIGTQYEGEARVEYWLRTGNEVEQTGFVLHPRFNYLGSSPDGLVNPDGGLEIKVPLFTTHCSYLESGEIPEEYMLQMYTNMLCCERSWWDFVSYCPPDVAPELPDEFRMFKKRLEADQTMFDAIEEAATVTMQHVAERMETLRRMYPAKGAAKSKFVAELEMSTDMADTLAAYDEYVMGETA